MCHHRVRVAPLVDRSCRPICPQPKFKSIEEELFNLTEDCIPDQALKQCEFECLNMNITCPADATPASHYPVMIWIHGYAPMTCVSIALQPANSL